LDNSRSAYRESAEPNSAFDAYKVAALRSTSLCAKTPLANTLEDNVSNPARNASIIGDFVVQDYLNRTTSTTANEQRHESFDVGYLTAPKSVGPVGDSRFLRL
jgi:hypothetical protein